MKDAVMSLSSYQFDEIAMGELTPEAAQRIIGPILKEGDKEQLQLAYTALRAWTWKAMNERRRDEELRVWHQLLRGYSTYLLKRDPCFAARLQVLYELVYESISISEVLPVAEVLNRTHVAKALVALLRSNGYRMERDQMRHILQINQGNLTRVMAMALASGLVTRSSSGKAAQYTLTAEGQRHAIRLGISQGSLTTGTRSIEDTRPKVMPPRKSVTSQKALSYNPRLKSEPDPNKPPTYLNLRDDILKAKPNNRPELVLEPQPTNRPVPMPDKFLALAGY